MAKTKITDLQFDERNFNKGSEKGNRLLEKSIQKFGFREAAVLDKNGAIVGGNKRIGKAGEVGFEEVQIFKGDPTKAIAIQFDDIDLDTPEGRELALALNQTAKENIVFDAEVIEATLEEAVVQEWELPKVDKFIDGGDDDLTDLSDKIKSEFKIEIVCKDEEQQEKTYNKLIEEGYECRLLTL